MNRSEIENVCDYFFRVVKASVVSVDARDSFDSGRDWMSPIRGNESQPSVVGVTTRGTIRTDLRLVWPPIPILLPWRWSP